MKKEELIKLLEQLPDDVNIFLFHDKDGGKVYGEYGVEMVDDTEENFGIISFK